MIYCVVLTNTTDVYVDSYVNFWFCFKYSRSICL